MPGKLQKKKKRYVESSDSSETSDSSSDTDSSGRYLWKWNHGLEISSVNTAILGYLIYRPVTMEIG